MGRMAWNLESVVERAIRPIDTLTSDTLMLYFLTG